MNPRPRLLTAVVVLCVLAAALGFFVVMQKSPEAARSRLLVDVLLLAALTGSVFVVTRNPLERREELLDAMRALARGVRDRRLDYERFGELEDVARTYNELAASLTEHEDPNLGPVKAKRRQQRPSWMEPESSQHPELGEVRVISKKEKAAPAKSAEERAAKAKARPPEEPAESAWERKAKAAETQRLQDDAAVEVEERPEDSAPPHEGNSAPPARAGEAASDEAAPARADERAHDDGGAEAGDDDDNGRPAFAAADNDTAVDALLTSSDAPKSSQSEAVTEAPRRNDAGAETLPPFDMRALFREFVEAKRAHDEETDDLEFESFAETLEDEMSRLVEAHGCRAVRFEVRVQDGEVSLLPRLLR